MSYKCYIKIDVNLADRGVSHSAMTDMQTIDQKSPAGTDYDRGDRYSSRGRDRFDDDFEYVGGPPK